MTAPSGFIAYRSPDPLYRVKLALVALTLVLAVGGGSRWAGMARVSEPMERRMTSATSPTQTPGATTEQRANTPEDRVDITTEAAP